MLQENLRQLCVYQLANDADKPWLWWDYVTRFGEQCTMAGKSYDEACAEKVRACLRLSASKTLEGQRREDDYGFWVLGF